MHVWTKSIFAVAFLLVVGLEQSQGAVIVSNLAAADNGAGTVYAPPQPQAYAQEFTTGSQGALLGSVITVLGPTTGSFTTTAQLLANNAGTPGAVLTSFSVPAIPAATYGDVTFNPMSSVMLSANTNYWFELSAAGTGYIKWQYTNATNAQLPNYASSHDLGVTWSVDSGAPFLI